MTKRKHDKNEQHIPFPMDRYMYFRDALRAATEARRELMEHLQVLIERETRRHQDAWDELTVIAGFKNVADLHNQNKEMLINWDTQTLVVREKRR